MAKFTAGTVLEPLEYDFTAYQPAQAEDGQHVAGWAGVIPEPSQDAIDRFIQATVALAPTGDAGRVQEISAAALPQMRDALAELCGGTPSRDTLAAVPFRILVAFIGWLMGTFTPQ